MRDFQHLRRRLIGPATNVALRQPDRISLDDFEEVTFDEPDDETWELIARREASWPVSR